MALTNSASTSTCVVSNSPPCPQVLFRRPYPFLFAHIHPTHARANTRTRTARHANIYSANEKLQSTFNKTIFRDEMALYESEGVKSIPELTLPDNSAVIAAIGQKSKKHPSVFVLLDDEQALGKRGSSTSFFKNVIKIHCPKPGSRRKKDAPAPVITYRAGKSYFTVNHFAGTVDYTPDEFLDKNEDSLFPQISEVLSASTDNSVLAQLFSNSGSGSAVAGAEGESKRSGGRGNKSKVKSTVAGVFRHDIDSLVRAIETTTAHYVRCIKSNPGQQPGVFDNGFILKQLKCAGIPEAGAILKAGYPFRNTHSEFRAQNKALVEDQHGRSFLDAIADDKEWCQKFVDRMAAGPLPTMSGAVVGKTMVLLNGVQNVPLSNMRNDLVDDMEALEEDGTEAVHPLGDEDVPAPISVSLAGPPPDDPPPPSGVSALIGVAQRQQELQQGTSSSPTAAESGASKSSTPRKKRGTVMDIKTGSFHQGSPSRDSVGSSGGAASPITDHELDDDEGVLGL